MNDTKYIGLDVHQAKISAAVLDFAGKLVMEAIRGMKPTMARLTLARKIAAITLIVWKKGVDFDAHQFPTQTSRRVVPGQP
jgi:hypothetical protein